MLVLFKPLDKNLIKELVNQEYTIVTIEDNLISGGLGSNVLQYVNTLSKDTKVVNLGFNDNL